MKIVKPSVVLEWITPDAERVIEMAGRTCYKSESAVTPESSAAFVRRLIASGHESVIEHAVASLRFVCDRGVTHELVRHRLVSYSQESTRYCNYAGDRFGGEVAFIKPPGLDEESEGDWMMAMKNAELSYLGLINRNVKPQIARSVLPTCLKTEILTTANLREWRHMLKLRTSPAAHPQMREIMTSAWTILQSRCPNVFFDITLDTDVKGG
jgi:thymidylate synthase (FAD)